MKEINILNSIFEREGVQLEEKADGTLRAKAVGDDPTKTLDTLVRLMQCMQKEI